MRCARKFTKPSISRGREIGLTQMARVSAGKGALGCKSIGFRDQYLSGEEHPFDPKSPVSAPLAGRESIQDVRKPIRPEGVHPRATF